MSDDRALFLELAVPRRVGTPNHTRVKDILKRELTGRRLVVMEQQFPASGARLATVALLGVCLAWGAIGSVMLVLLSRTPWAIGGWFLAVTAAALHLLFRSSQSRRPSLDAGWMGTNLIAVRPRARVETWLVAHYDSKGQPFSMAGRLVVVALCGLGVLGLLALAAGQLGVLPLARPLRVLLAVPALLGGWALSGNRATDGSPGAVDDASGLVTVLAALDALPSDSRVGVVFTDAEELGLLGARALARERANLFNGTAVINIDGIDDSGRLLVLVHRPGPAVDALAARLGAARSRWLPVVVDGSALAAAAAECVTIMKGKWETMRVVHTAMDTADRLTLEGVKAVTRAIVAAVAPSSTG